MHRQKKTTLDNRKLPGVVGIDWFLNEYSDTEAGQRILELVKLFKAYGAEVTRARAAHRTGEMVCMIDTVSDSVYQKLHAALDRYRFRMVVNHAFLPAPNKWPEHSFQIDLSRSVGSQERSKWIGKARTFGEGFHKGKIVWEGGVKALREESAATLEAFSLIQLPQLLHQGKISWLRQCSVPHCARWFMSKRKAQIYCLSKCARWAYEKTPEYRSARAKYMRDYYAENLSAAKPKKRPPSSPRSNPSPRHR